MDDLLKEIIKTLDTKLDYLSKENTYIVDKSFIEAWIEEKGSADQVAFVSTFIDLLTHLKKHIILLPNLIVPVDVLNELETDGKKYILDKDFIDAFNTLVKIKEVHPSRIFSGQIESVYEMAKQFEKAKYKTVILTLEKSNYTPTESIFPLTPKEIFTTIVIIYNLLSDLLSPDLKKVYDTWISGMDNNSN